MQIELTALQPQLIQTSEETDKMMVKIEEETRKADAKKFLVQADEKEANASAAIAQGIKVCITGRNPAFSFCLSFFLLFRAIYVTYGGSQARCPIGAAAAGLHHSHSNARSEPRL